MGSSFDVSEGCHNCVERVVSETGTGPGTAGVLLKVVGEATRRREMRTGLFSLP